MRLTLDELPPLHVPLRFFLTAPVFGILAGLLWSIEGDVDFSTRWTTGMLAATHLFTLGFMAMVMVGALFQVVPVLGGGAIPNTLVVAPLVHATLTSGTACLALGLYRHSVGWLVAALALLGTAFVVFVPALAWRVLRFGRGGTAMHSIRFAVLSLAVTVGIGVAMAMAIVWPELGFAYRGWTDRHASFGFAGWMLCLIVGVSQQVVPMFHVTPPFPRWLGRAIAPLVFTGLLLLCLPMADTWAVLWASLIAVPGIVHAVTILRLLAKRKRRRAEPVVRAWQLAMAWLIASMVFGWKLACLPELRVPGIEAHQEGLLLAVGFGLGGVATAIVGMLSKIVPFLAFTHLQRRCLLAPAAIPLLPAMNEIVTDREATQVLVAHTLACVAAVIAVLVPQCGRVAGLAVVVGFALCLRNQVLASRRYRRAACAIGAAVAAKA